MTTAKIILTDCSITTRNLYSLYYLCYYYFIRSLPPPPRFFLDFVGRNYGHGLLFDGATVTSAKWDFGTGVRTGKF